MKIDIRAPSDACPEWSLVELQGKLNFPQNEPELIQKVSA